VFGQGNCLKSANIGKIIGRFILLYHRFLPIHRGDAAEEKELVQEQDDVLRRIDAAWPAEASRMHNLPDDEKIQYLRNMITEEERLDMGQAYYQDGFKDGFDGGKKVGFEDGKQETQKDNIMRLLKFGMSPKDIATALDVPEETVKSYV